MMNCNIPTGMKDKVDHVCMTCFNVLKEQGKSNGNHGLLSLEADLNKRSEAAKNKWNKNGVYVWKGDNTACLQKRHNGQVQFFLAFEDLTQEGFILKAQDEGKEGQAGGFSGGMNSFYFFQRSNVVSTPSSAHTTTVKSAGNSAV